MTAVLRSRRPALREAGIFAAFSLGYIALFIGVPPTPLCAVGACAVSPRPEAFLLAAAVPFGLSAILGVSSGVFAAALLYEMIHPMGTTVTDGGVAFLVFLVACGSGAWIFRRRPTPEMAIVTTSVITALVTLMLGTYGYGLKGSDLPDAILGILGEAVIPINVAGPLFLSWAPIRKLAGEGLGKPVEP